MDSDYCYSIEMKKALERRARGEAEVIPIILRHVYWHGEPLGKLQALPKDGKPVTDPDWYNLDRAFYDVTTGIRKVVEQLNTHHAPTQPAVEQKIQQEKAKSNIITSTAKQISKVPPPRSLLAVNKLALHHTLTNDSYSVRSVAISADGQTLVGSGDKTINIWGT